MIAVMLAAALWLGLEVNESIRARHRREAAEQLRDAVRHLNTTTTDGADQ
jgi:hypothetical protein